MKKKLLGVSVCLLLLAAACSESNPYQFALDAIQSKPGFDKGLKHWAMKYDPSATPSSSAEAYRHAQLEVQLLSKNNSERPLYGSIVACWQHKDRKVWLTIFDSTTKAERADTLLLTTECF